MDQISKTIVFLVQNWKSELEDDLRFSWNF